VDERLANVFVKRGQDSRRDDATRADQWRDARLWFEKRIGIWNEWTRWGVANSFDSRLKARMREAVARSAAAIGALRSEKELGPALTPPKPW
jgi:hypothetical protein